MSTSNNGNDYNKPAKETHLVEATNDEEMETEIFEVSSSKQPTDRRMRELFVDGNPIQFKIDTGSDANIINKKVYEQLKDSKPLTKLDTGFVSYLGKDNLPILGLFHASISYKNCTTSTEINVINSNTAKNLL